MRALVSVTACIMLLLALLMQGCGHKGALFLPPPSGQSK
jgi:predicted small lipoprotein YifL